MALKWRKFFAQTDHLGGKVEQVIGYNKLQTDFTQEISKLTRNGISAAKAIG